MLTHVTPAVWGANLTHPMYGTPDTYQLAAAWLKDCQTVADWGGSTGYFGTLLPPTTRYHVVDGTWQTEGQVVADLRTYREPADGILLRHTLEINDAWRDVLANALEAFRRRLVVVLHTPHASPPVLLKHKSGWPIYHLDHDELRRLMGGLLVADTRLQTSHPERMFFLERPA